MMEFAVALPCMTAMVPIVLTWIRVCSLGELHHAIGDAVKWPSAAASVRSKSNERAKRFYVAWNRTENKYIMNCLHRRFLFGLVLCSIACAAHSIVARSIVAQEHIAAQPSAKFTIGARLPDAKKLIASYCYDCHDKTSKEGGLDLTRLLDSDDFDATLVFENLITAKMPPSDADQPTATEKRELLNWLVTQQTNEEQNSFRRISRHEFGHALNDLVGTNLDITGLIPEDRGTRDFDSDRKIMLTKEMLTAYFSAADNVLDFAFPVDGFHNEQIWTTSQIMDSHPSYNIYVRDHRDGLLFSWTRANNGNAYSFFYDKFEPPVKGWYELTFDAAKMGDFKEDISIQVYAGKYYFADDRPQPQRLLGVISVGNQNVKPHTLQGFLYPGERVSVHCYSKHTWRKTTGDQGALIKQLKVRGPVFDQWPTKSYQKTFANLPLKSSPRVVREVRTSKSALEQIGGSISVSSFQSTMEKEKMLDGEKKTFWHTRFQPTVAKPPHYVILKNPAKKEISGLTYSTWSGGNGNGQVKSFSISVSDDGKTWQKPIASGNLEVMSATRQKIVFPTKIDNRFIKFLVTDAVSLDGKSLASIGELDVLTALSAKPSKTKISVASQSQRDLKRVIKRFAENAFSTSLTEAELNPYYQVSLKSLRENGDFVRATRHGLKAVVCSHRFLLTPGSHRNNSYRIAAGLARTLWLSVPDQKLLKLAQEDQLSEEMIRSEIDRMLNDKRTHRMIHSFCGQWLGLHAFNKISPSLKLYPNYDDLLNYYLPIETESYIHHLIQENHPIAYLIDSDFSILNQRLAQHYGIDGVIGQEMRKVSFQQRTPRGGLLTMGSVLKVTTDGFQTSPILRGAWLSKNIVGNTLSPPPENITAIEPDLSKATTLKEQIEKHKNNDTCYACHKSIDPYGFALENFDATGQWRSKYRAIKPHRSTFQYRPQGYFDVAGEVEASGELDDIKFETVFELKKILLLDHKRVAYNFAKKFFEYANGYKPNLKQRIDIFEMIPHEPDKSRVRDLIIKVLTYSFLGDRA